MNPLSPHDWLDALGPAALLVVLFAETGLLVGFFLPGDSLLFTAGVLSASSRDGLHVSYLPALVCAAAGALLGSQCGYLLGRRAGPTLLDGTKHPKLRESAARATVQLQRYGVAKALVLGRFIPVVRTVVNPLAGALNVPVRVFTFWQVLGGLVWTIGILVTGHQVGHRIPSIDRYVLPVVALAVLVSVIPVLLEVRRARRVGAR
ncbi:MAG TPA: DedA family protein [Sporichthyaceae bacterium]